MKIDIDVPIGKSGNWAVENFIVSEQDETFFNLREAFQGSDRSIIAGQYKKLIYNKSVIMSNTPAEIQDHIKFINIAKKRKNILINGLGLGVCLKAILESKTIKSVTIIENSLDVIKLVAPTYLKDIRVSIKHADAFTFETGPNAHYDAVWHDIWPTICADNLKEIEVLKLKYEKIANWQGSWCEKECNRYNKRW